MLWGARGQVGSVTYHLETEITRPVSGRVGVQSQVCLLQMLLFLPLPFKFGILDCLRVFKSSNLPKHLLSFFPVNRKNIIWAGKLGTGLFPPLPHPFLLHLLFLLLLFQCTLQNQIARRDNMNEEQREFLFLL